LRTLVAIALIGILALCPVVCGAEEFGHGAHRHGTSDDAGPAPSAPVHCPEEGDNCICQGAVQSVDVRLPDADLFGLSLDCGTLGPIPPHPLAHLTCDGSPAGLAGWGNAHAIRSYLQNFRC
jgi:hypothetical protein